MRKIKEILIILVDPPMGRNHFVKTELECCDRGRSLVQFILSRQAISIGVSEVARTSLVLPGHFGNMQHVSNF